MPRHDNFLHSKAKISNSNRTEWSTIQGVIERVISKSDKREARGRFEITSTNRIYNKFRKKMSSENFFEGKRL